MRVLRRLYPERQHDPFRAAAPLGEVTRPVEMIDPASPLQQRVAHRVQRRRLPLEQRLGLAAQPVQPVVPAEDAPAQRHGLPHPGPALPRRPAPGPLLGRDAARDLEHPGPRRLDADDAIRVVPRQRPARRCRRPGRCRAGSAPTSTTGWRTPPPACRRRAAPPPGPPRPRPRSHARYARRARPSPPRRARPGGRLRRIPCLLPWSWERVDYSPGIDTGKRLPRPAGTTATIGARADAKGGGRKKSTSYAILE